MDKETEKLLIVVGITLVILWIAKPKNTSILQKTSDGFNLLPPKTVSTQSIKEQDNGYIGISAMRSAIDNGEPKSELDRLNRELLTQYGVKVFLMNNDKLCARNRRGQTVAKEQ